MNTTVIHRHRIFRSVAASCIGAGFAFAWSTGSPADAHASRACVATTATSAQTGWNTIHQSAYAGLELIFSPLYPRT